MRGSEGQRGRVFILVRKGVDRAVCDTVESSDRPPKFGEAQATVGVDGRAEPKHHNFSPDWRPATLDRRGGRSGRALLVDGRGGTLL